MFPSTVGSGDFKEQVKLEVWAKYSIILYSIATTKTADCSACMPTAVGFAI